MNYTLYFFSLYLYRKELDYYKFLIPATMRRENYTIEKEELLTAQMSQRENIRRQIYFSSSSNIEQIDEEKNYKKYNYYDDPMSYTFVSDWQVS